MASAAKFWKRNSSSASERAKNYYETNALQDRFSWNKMRRRQDLSNKMRRRPDFWTKSWWVLYPIDIVCNLFLTNHSSESSSFNELINEWIYGLINLWPAYSTVVFPAGVKMRIILCKDLHKIWLLMTCVCYGSQITAPIIRSSLPPCRIQVAQAYTCVHKHTLGLSRSTLVASCLDTGTRSCATNMEAPGKVISYLYACTLHCAESTSRLPLCVCI